MRAARILTVIGLGGSALLLAFGFLWFFGVTPVFVAADSPKVAPSTPTVCDRTIEVRNGAALSNAFKVKISAGEELCLVEAGDGAVAYSMDAASPGVRLFSIAASLSDADLAQIGLQPVP